MRNVQIGNIEVGDGFPVVFVAELGTFYNQDIGMALEFIDLAADAGAPVIKSEILHDPEVFYSKDESEIVYHHAAGVSRESYRELIRRKVITIDNYRKIIRRTQARGIPFIASVYDFAGVDLMVEEGGAAIKLWRNNYNNFPLIKYAASTGLPIIFDFAFLHEDEMIKAVRYARENGSSGVIVNHHPGANPSPAPAHNLNVLKRYKKLMSSPVGLSCHYRGDEILYAAVGAGVNLIEKGVYTNPDHNDQNVVSTASFNELEGIIRKIHLCWQAMGSSQVKVPEQRDHSLLYGLVTRRAVKKGEKLNWENTRFSFPCKGIPVEDWDKIEGAELKRDLPGLTAIGYNDIDFSSC